MKSEKLESIGQMSRRWIFAILLIALTCPMLKAQSKLTYAQSIFLLKSLKPSLKSLGIIGSTLTEQDIKSLGRAGLGQGIKITVAKVSDVKEISSLYKMLTAEHKAELVWIPDESDELLLGLGFEFLRENTILDRIGLIVPTRALVSKGALCSLESTSDEKVVVYVNKRIAQVDGINPPSNQDAAVQFVLQ